MKKKSVVVLMGGWSAERDVSLSSGKGCAAALRGEGYDVREVDVQRDLQDLVRQLTPKPDAVFNALHGRFGEDGCVQGILEMLGIPYTHSGVMASALAMNKQAAKDAVQTAGVPCPKGQLVHIDEIRAGRVPLDPPFVVKPNQEGSSVGVYIVRAGDNRTPLTLEDWSYGDFALVEEFIPGRELTVSVMGTKTEAPRALTVTDITPRGGFYDYDSKYADGGSAHVLPAQVPANVFEAALHFAVIAHKKLQCSGVSRTDFRYNENQPDAMGLFYLETNTQPGMTPTSLVPEQAAHAGISFGALVSWLVENASLHT